VAGVTEIAVAFEHVSKKFRRGELHDSLRDLVPALVRGSFRRASAAELRGQEFWALDDVNFEVCRGEAFGIVGHNGAGKSTVLKLLCRIMQPTLGRLHLEGRVSGLLEIGAGFHPDLTGRENVYLNGTILGMSRREIARKFDEIVEFSGISDFIDTPVKRYSSGMFARLGFSVAAHLEPDIVVIDEVLSVGDYLFQKKSLDKMRSLVETGATVLFVSHNLKAVADLCQRCAALEHGKVTGVGPTDQVLRQYLEESSVRRSREDADVHLARYSVRGAEGPKRTFQSGERVWVDMEVTARNPVRGVGVGIFVFDDAFNGVFGTTTERLGVEAFSLEAGESLHLSFALDLHLCRGTFHLGGEVIRRDIQKLYDRWQRAASIVVASDRDSIGVAELNASVEVASAAADRPPAAP